MGSLCSQQNAKESLKPVSSPSKSTNTSKISISRFSVIRLLNEGAFGKVVLGLKKDDQQLYALKVVSKRGLEGQAKRACALEQMNILNAVKSDFVVSLHFAFQNSNNFYLVLEFVEGGDLFIHLERRRLFPFSTAQFCLAEILLGLEDLHKCSIVYRDLKPENVLVDSQGHLKLADFNMSAFVQQGHSTTTPICGTPEYISPEVIQGLPHGRKVDFWNLGVVLYEMMTGFPPFQGQSSSQSFKSVLSGRYMPPMVQKEAVDLINWLLQLNPEDRPDSIDDIKQHKFFRGIDWNKLKNRQIESPLEPILYMGDSTTPTSPLSESSTPRTSIYG